MKSNLWSRKLKNITFKNKKTLFFVIMLIQLLVKIKLMLNLLSPDPLDYFTREVQKRRDEETNLWSEPGDPSHSERDDDRTLYTLLQARNQTRVGSTVRQDASENL